MKPPAKWPTIEDDYTAEAGKVEAEVHTAAGAIWPAAQRLGISALHDEGTAAELMTNAAAIVSRRRADGLHIENLPAFIFQVYKRLVLGELKKRNRRIELDAQWECDVFFQVADELDRKILIEQLYRQMDEWTRNVFQLRLLGYTFEEIGDSLGIGANHVRSEFGKRLARLRRNLQT